MSDIPKCIHEWVGSDWPPPLYTKCAKCGRKATEVPIEEGGNVITKPPPDAKQMAERVVGLVEDRLAIAQTGWHYPLPPRPGDVPDMAATIARELAPLYAENKELREENEKLKSKVPALRTYSQQLRGEPLTPYELVREDNKRLREALVATKDLLWENPPNLRLRGIEGIEKALQEPKT